MTKRRLKKHIDLEEKRKQDVYIRRRPRSEQGHSQLHKSWRKMYDLQSFIVLAELITPLHFHSLFPCNHL